MSPTSCYICLSFVTLLSLGQNVDQERRVVTSCEEKKTCTDCLRLPTCMWCTYTKSSEVDNEPSIRCVPWNKYKDPTVWCPIAHIINDTTNVIVENDEPQLSAKNKQPAQIKPKLIKLRLRLDEEYKFVLNYSRARDYPIDLYYLMDLSASMETHREDLSELGADLASAMRNLTSNFRLGFGSFVDKVELPMTSTSPDRLLNPCINTGNKNCARPYGYKHQMNLTPDWESFKANVIAAPLSGNIDRPEGGFDALMQAIVCQKRIGWRQDARRLLVFSTDAEFHIAGDGRLAGIVEPNDCKCHLDENGSYTHSSLLDYPSISQINRAALDKKINIMFAVTKDIKDAYERLNETIKGSATGIIKENDGANVINLIKAEYERLVNKVHLIDNAKKPVSIKYFSKCLEENGELKEQSKCHGSHFPDTIQFEVVIKVTECSENPAEWKHKIEINPQGLDDSLIIELELICDCPCDKTNHMDYVKNAPKCNNNGDLTCGICKCYEGFYGKHCVCSGNETQSNVKDNCRAVNDTVDCSNHGRCQCGVCECEIRENPEESFSGDYCECNNFSCLRDNDQLCGGHGNCTCGSCVCDGGWTGPSCGCRGNSTCFPPGVNTKICSDHGTCECGMCNCENDILYTPGFCQDCQSCSEVHCSKLKECVECKTYNTGPRWKNGTCERCYDDVKVVSKVDKVYINSDEYEAGFRLCNVSTDDRCSFDFKYHIVSNVGDMPRSYVTVEGTKKCPKPIPIFTVALSVIISTVVLGFLILLIWKIYTTVHDKREFAKFERERALAKWERADNPLYKQATMTFNNPTFMAGTQSSTGNKY